jgi:UDPglucose 6-dehydrogenase
MRIAMIGTGYVGLVSAACLAEFGNHVVCIDKDREKIDALVAGRIPIFEPGLDELVAANVRARRLSFTTVLAEAIAEADLAFIAVGTPPRGDGRADLGPLWSATREMARALKGFTTVVVKSTVPVGTCDEVARLIRQTNGEAEFSVCSNPEFLREGAAIADFLRPDRVVVGYDSERGRSALADAYRPLIEADVPFLFTTRRNSELIKYAANAFLAIKVAYINEIADLCEKVGGEVAEVARGIGLDRRIGPAFLRAGPGYGGSCFPKDTMALRQLARSEDVSLGLVEAAITSNEMRKHRMSRRIISACGGSVSGKRIGILGLAFKANTDDMRESPSIPIINALAEAGASVQVFDPAAMASARPHLPHVRYASTAYDAAVGADALVVLTEWPEFAELDFARMRASMAGDVILDLRNILDPPALRDLGFRYIAIGQGGDAAVQRYPQAAE